MSSPCPVLDNAIKAKRVSYSQIAQTVGTTEGRVDEIVSGRARPTQQELDSLTRSLDIKNALPRSAAHTTT